MSLNAEQAYGGLPFFTAEDHALVRATSVRDPLGVLPVWSGIGRELVPHLASGVVNLNGIKAVLLIHWLLQEPLKEFAARNFRWCFRLLEGLVEWYLWHHAAQGHCFGTRALASPGSFRVQVRDAGTAVNGLYQYYSGTCRRAGLVDADWKLSVEAGASLRQCWSAAATAALAPEVRRVLDNPKREGFEPAQVLGGSEALVSALKKVLASSRLTIVLQERLLGSPAQVALARHCAEVRQSSGERLTANQYAEELRDRLMTPKDPAGTLLPSLGRVEQCEQFLVVLQDSYDLLRAMDRRTLPDAAAILAPRLAEYMQAAQRFSALFVSGASERDGQIAALAMMLGQGSTEAFLHEVVAHHQRLVKERGADPLLTLEEGRIVAPLAPDRSLAAVRTHLESGLPWNNGYYLSTAGAIHRQLYWEAA